VPSPSSIVVWFTGLPASGKSTLAARVQHALSEEGRQAVILDGDAMRRGLCRDLGFSSEDRAENVRRVAEVARLFVDAGLIVLVALVSPLRVDRAKARALFGPGELIEVFVDTPVGECEARDPKGLYARARAGAVTDLTGVGSPYEPPETPDLVVNTAGKSIDESAGEVLGYVRRVLEGDPRREGL
jgi:adenylyl-sulfate kinase